MMFSSTQQWFPISAMPINHSHLVESGDIFAFGCENSGSGVIGAHLVLWLHGGSRGEAQLEDASIDIARCDNGHQTETSKQDSHLSALVHLNKEVDMHYDGL